MNPAVDKWANAEAAIKYITKHFRTNDGGRVQVYSFWYEFFQAFFDPLIRVLILSLPKQSGKTTLCLSAIRYVMCRAYDYYIIALSNAEKQTARFTRQKIQHPLNHECKALQDAFDVKIPSGLVEVPSRRNSMTILPANAATSTGTSAPIIYIDEAAYMLQRVFSQIVMSARKAKNPKVLITSSADEPIGFFHKLCTKMEAHPERYPHQKLIWIKNMDAAELVDETGVDKWLFDLMDCIDDGTSVIRYLKNDFAADGECLMDSRLVEAAVDDSLILKASTKNQCFGFIDTSNKTDLTSLAIVDVVDLEDKRLELSRLTAWEPSTFEHGRINYDVIKTEIEFVIREFGPMKILVDCTSGDGNEIINWAWSPERRYMTVQPFHAHNKYLQPMWSDFETVITEGRFKMPRVDKLIAEMKSIKKQFFGSMGQWHIQDGNFEGRKIHRDLSFSVAGAVWQAVEDMGRFKVIRIMKSKNFWKELKNVNKSDNEATDEIRG